MRRTVRACSLFIAAFFAAAPVSADPPVRTQAGVPVPGRSVAGSDQASAIAQNPANLAFLPAPELRWTWVRTGDASPYPDRGHAFDLATPLPFRLSTGLRLDFVRPPPSAAPAYADTYAWLSWALAVRASDAFSIGTSIRHSSSGDARYDGLTSLSLAASSRSTGYLGASLVARDVNAPSTSSGAHLDRSYEVALAVRPTGKRVVELGIEGRIWPAYDTIQPRATLGIDVPYVGRLRGDWTMGDPTSSGSKPWVATAGLEIAGIGSQTTTVEGGGVFGSALGTGRLGKGGAGFYMGASIAGYRSPGLPERGYAEKIRLEGTPGNRSHVHLLRRLWAMAKNPEVRAVVLQLREEPASSLAHGEELIDAIELLRARGKKVICHLHDAQGRSLQVCSHADRTVVSPAGGLRFAGLRLQYQYYAGLLGKLGVRAQFVRIGAHKGAPEQFTREGATEVARADHLDQLHEYEEVFLSEVAAGRRIAPDRLQAVIASGPFVASEAIAAGLVDGVAFDDEIDRVVAETVGEKIPVHDDPPPPVAPSRFGGRRGVAVVYLEGDMVDGRSKDVPLLGMHLAGSTTIAKALKQVREDPSVGAVVLRIESPGGSSLAADVMYREVQLTAKVKPVIVSMGSVAASGGYYAAAAGTQIWASPLTVTGSIGIFYGKADVAELFQKIGVNVETYKTAPRADAESIYRPFTPEELDELGKKVGQFYGVFLDRVSEGRHMPREQVDAVGQGHVWTGRQALARRLVDRLGGLRQAMDEARRLASLPDDAPVTELPTPLTSLLDLAMSLAGVSEPQPATALLPPQLVQIGRALAPFTVFAADEPLARMELVVDGEP